MAEPIKKAKAPSKAKKAVVEKAVDTKPATKKAAGKTTTESAIKIAKGTVAPKTGIAIVKPVSQQEVAELAHRYWAERGYQHGQHVDDWFRAEQELRGKAS